MNIMKIALASAAATVALSGAAMAQDSLKLSYNVGVASDYVFRGVSNTQEDPQIFGGVDATYGIGYAGVWASNVDFGVEDPSAEIDIYAGVKPVVGDTNLDLGLVYYGYSKDKGIPGSFSYLELKAAASRSFGPATLGVVAFYSPEFPADTGRAFYYEVNGSLPVSEKISVSAALGHQEIKLAGDYNTWNIGATYAITSNLGLDLRYHDTDEHGYGAIYDSRVAVSLKAAF
ncbi:TorF family putative porin [Caulobacter sp. ErkDOM-E]|uniref:TorF family putative porin n=1 Tax=Caulobacter sp. ErkDOM-E TaxID=3402778 RepID=UPI003AF5781F